MVYTQNLLKYDKKLTETDPTTSPNLSYLAVSDNKESATAEIVDINASTRLSISALPDKKTKIVKTYKVKKSDEEIKEEYARKKVLIELALFSVHKSAYGAVGDLLASEPVRWMKEVTRMLHVYNNCTRVRSFGTDLDTSGNDVWVIISSSLLRFMDSCEPMLPALKQQEIYHQIYHDRAFRAKIIFPRIVEREEQLFSKANETKHFGAPMVDSTDIKVKAFFEDKFIYKLLFGYENMFTNKERSMITESMTLVEVYMLLKDVCMNELLPYIEDNVVEDVDEILYKSKTVMHQNVGISFTKLVRYFYLKTLLNKYKTKEDEDKESEDKESEDVKKSKQKQSFVVNLETYKQNSSTLLRLIKDETEKNRVNNVLEKLNRLCVTHHELVQNNVEEELDTLTKTGFKVISHFSGHFYKIKTGRKYHTDYGVYTATSYSLLEKAQSQLLLQDISSTGMFPTTCDELAGNVFVTHASKNRNTIHFPEGYNFVPLTKALVSVSALLWYKESADLALHYMVKHGLAPFRARHFSVLLDHLMDIELKKRVKDKYLEPLIEKYTPGSKAIFYNNPDEIGKLLTVYTPLRIDYRGRWYSDSPVAIQAEVWARSLYTSSIYHVTQEVVVLLKAYMASLAGCSRIVENSFDKHASWWMAADRLTESQDKGIKNLVTLQSLISDTQSCTEDTIMTRAIELDATASGGQIISLLMDDVNLSRCTNIRKPVGCNLILSQESYLGMTLDDMYEDVRKGILNETVKTEEDEEHNFKDVLEQIVLTSEEVQELIKAQIAEKDNSSGKFDVFKPLDTFFEHVTAVLLHSEVFNRSFVKGLVVPTLYGKGEAKTKKYILDLIKPISIVVNKKEFSICNLHPSASWMIADKIYSKYMKVLNAKFPSITKFFTSMRFIAKYHPMKDGISWTLYDQFRVECHNYKTVTKQFNAAKSSIDKSRKVTTVKYLERDKKTGMLVEDRDAFSRSLPPNFIHSADACIARNVVQRMAKLKHVVSCVHDAFIVAPNGAYTLITIYHEEIDKVVAQHRLEFNRLYKEAHDEYKRIALEKGSKSTIPLLQLPVYTATPLEERGLPIFV